MIKEEYEHLRLGCACTMPVESLHHKSEQNTAKLIVIMIKEEYEHLRLSCACTMPVESLHHKSEQNTAKADSNHD